METSEKAGNSNNKYHQAYTKMTKKPTFPLLANIFIVFIASLLIMWNTLPLEFVLIFSCVASIFIGTSIFLMIVVMYKILSNI